MASSGDCALLAAAFPSVNFPANCCDYTHIGEYDSTVVCDGIRVSLVSFPHQSFSGAIPPQLFELTGLVTLELTGNAYTGGFPDGVQRLPLLQYLLSGAFYYLADNQLGGPLPDIFGSTPALCLLDIGGQPFYGDLPPSLRNHKTLETLSVDRTCINRASVPTFSSLTADKPLAQCAAISASLNGAKQTTAAGGSDGGRSSADQATSSGGDGSSGGGRSAGDGEAASAAPMTTTLVNGTVVTIAAPAGGSGGGTGGNRGGGGGTVAGGAAVPTAAGSSSSSSSSAGGLSTTVLAAAAAVAGLVLLAAVVVGVAVVRRRRRRRGEEQWKDQLKPAGAVGGGGGGFGWVGPVGPGAGGAAAAAYGQPAAGAPRGQLVVDDAAGTNVQSVGGETRAYVHAANVNASSHPSAEALAGFSTGMEEAPRDVKLARTFGSGGGEKGPGGADGYGHLFPGTAAAGVGAARSASVFGLPNYEDVCAADEDEKGQGRPPFSPSSAAHYPPDKAQLQYYGGGGDAEAAAASRAATSSSLSTSSSWGSRDQKKRWGFTICIQLTQSEVDEEDKYFRGKRSLEVNDDEEEEGMNERRKAVSLPDSSHCKNTLPHQTPMSCATPRSALHADLLIDIAVLAATDLVASANGSLAPVQLPATQLRILALASPFPSGDIACFVKPGWPKGLSRAEREELLLCWLDNRLARCDVGQMEIAEVFSFSIGMVQSSLDWTRWHAEPLRKLKQRFLNVAATDNHVRLAERLLALGDSPTWLTFHETIRCDHDDVLRLIAAKSPPVFAENARLTILADAARFGSLKCMRVLFGLLRPDRFANVVLGAVGRACADLNVTGLRGLRDLEAEFRPAGTPSAFEGDESGTRKWLEEALSSFLFHADC
ncbi:hypothetical protein DFJ73DRAFT_959088 [Zopfochytrium polystomum]|nr:hypothetical protein DFJ73DRAFT_959088 [Zopfochytrium polystomum]